MDGGGVIISADPGEYKDFLSDFLRLSNKCYFATLRGGKYNPKYRLRWFFNDDPDHSKNPHALTKEQKKAYLKEVNDFLPFSADKESIYVKKRILFFEETEKEFCEDFIIDQWRNEFFAVNKKVENYLASPESVINFIGKSEFNADFIYEDYAIFDNEIVLKHNSNTSLYIASKDQIKSFMAVFNLLEKKPLPGCFKLLTNDNIGDVTWEDYKKRFSAKT